MKKVIYSILLASVVQFSGLSQAVLPTTWGFSTTILPTGWTESGTAFYTSGTTQPMMKFDGSGDKLIINFASAPGALTYYLTGNSFSGGTFLVEESIDGTAWTTLHSHTNPPSATYTLYTDMPNAASRYIRFNYLTKVTGNIGLDDVNIAVGAVTPEQEINVQQASTTIVSGGSVSASSDVAVLTPLTFAIQNLGSSSALTISSVVISGANASDYVVSTSPTSISAASSGNLVIDFTPSASGSRTGIVTINSNDVDENAYVININGVGGALATEPIAQPTNIVFSNVKTYRLTGSYTAASGVDGYIILRKNGSAITDVPVDGIVYDRGDAIGNSKVIFSSNLTSFTPNNIIAATDYHFAVFAYNGNGVYRNYLTTNPLTGTSTTPATMQSSTYYNGLNTSSSTFATELHDLVNPHQEQYYSNYGTKMIALFASRDTTDNQRVLTCVYSGENRVYTEPFDFTTNNFSREHTYCHDWMPTNPAQALPEYNDYHHLFPTNQNDANAIRSNKALGIVVNVQSTYLGAKYGTDANGVLVYEPRDEHKGDAARAMFYEAICYNSVSGNNWSLPSYQDQNVLKAWHLQDPPSNWEIARNDFIDSLQNNRNPFIDSVNYVCYINFSTMNYNSDGCATGVLTLTCPANQTINSTQQTTVPNLTTSAVASSTCPSGLVTKTQSPAVGSALIAGNNVITITATDCSNTETCTSTINYVVTAGVEENLENAFSIYPIPSKDIVYLKATGTPITGYEILDMQSRLVKSEDGINSNLVTINASKLKSGTYFVKVSSPIGKVIRKVVIE